MKQASGQGNPSQSAGAMPTVLEPYGGRNSAMKLDTNGALLPVRAGEVSHHDGKSRSETMVPNRSAG